MTGNQDRDGWLVVGRRRQRTGKRIAVVFFCLGVVLLVLGAFVRSAELFADALFTFVAGCGFGLWWWCIGIIDEGRAGEADS